MQKTSRYLINSFHKDDTPLLNNQVFMCRFYIQSGLHISYERNLTNSLSSCLLASSLTRQLTNLILMITCLYLDDPVLGRLLEQFGGGPIIVLVPPIIYIRIVFIVTFYLSLGCLVFLMEVTSTILITRDSIVSNEFAH